MCFTAAPLCGAYFVCEICLTPRLGSFAQACLFTTACLLLPANGTGCLVLGQGNRAYEDAFESDLRAGVPLFILAERYLVADAAAPNSVESVRPVLENLQQRRVGVFKFMAKDPDFHEVPLPLEPVAVHQTTWQDGAAHGHAGTSATASLTFGLDRPQFVYALRVRCVYEDTATTRVTLRTCWRDSRRADFTDVDPSNPQRRDERGLSVNPTEMVLTVVNGQFVSVPKHRETVATFWINDTIDQVRLYPDLKTCLFKPTALTLLVPASAKNFGERGEVNFLSQLRFSEQFGSRTWKRLLSLAPGDPVTRP